MAITGIDLPTNLVKPINVIYLYLQEKATNVRFFNSFNRGDFARKYVWKSSLFLAVSVASVDNVSFVVFAYLFCINKNI